MHIYNKFDTLNLDPDFHPLKKQRDQIVFKKFTFRGGEPHIQFTHKFDYFSTLKKDIDPIINERNLIITNRYKNLNDLFDVVLSVDAARRLGYKNISLVFPYFPAARQDRVCNLGEPLTIKIFTDIINNCNFDKVFILGPHSEVTPALLNNCEVIDLDFSFVTKSFSLLKECVQSEQWNNHIYNVVCPDAGAGKRVGKIATLLSNHVGKWAKVNLIRCEKVRDVSTGALQEFFCASNNLENAPTIIFDDLVSMGGTFLGLADLLRERNCGPLGIFTYHADCQEGLDNLETKFDGVFITNSKQDYKITNKTKIIKFEI